MRKSGDPFNRLPFVKITRPSSAGLLARKRLFNFVERMRKFPFLFIAGPPGSGKTSLLTSYLEDRRIGCLWYSLDKADAEVSTFFHYLRLAAQQLPLKKRVQLPVYSPDYEHGASFFGRRCFELLFEGIKPPFFFVFDNYHRIPLKSRFHDMLIQCLSDMPEGITVVILSRGNMPPPFSRLHIHHKVQPIGWETIKFTFGETKELIRRCVRVRFDEPAIQSLHGKADGWVAGILLFAREAVAEQRDFQSVRQISMNMVHHYLRREVFERRDNEIRKFLLMTSFLPVLTPAIAERLTGNSRSEKILRELSSECCFIQTLSDDNLAYRYHPLFREFLLSMANRAWSGDALSRIKVCAAEIVEETADVEEAAQLLIESGDTGKLAALIRKWAPIMARQGRNHSLLTYLDALPAEALMHDPWLLYWSGICRLPFHPAESLIFFEKAFGLFLSENEAAGVFCAWTGIVEAIIYGRAGLESLDPQMDVLENLLLQFGNFPSDEIEADVTCSVFRILALRKPLHVNTKKWLDRIHAVVETSADQNYRAKALVSLAGYLYSEGNFTHLEVALNSLRDFLKRYDVPPLVRLTATWLQAAFYNAMALYDACRQTVSEGLAMAGSLKIRLMEHMLLGHGAMSSLKKGDTASARQYLQQMASGLGSMKPWEEGFFHYCAAWGALYRNDTALAKTHAEQSLHIYKGIGNPWTLSIAHILRAYLFDLSKEYTKALYHVSQAENIGGRTGNAFISFICSLSRGYFYLRQGDEEHALEAIRAGLQTGGKHGFVNPYMYPPGMMEAVLTKALDHDAEGEYAKQLIRKNNLLPDIHSTVSDRWPFPIRIYTLGRFGIVKDGEPVHFAGKIQQRPLLMLKALIAFGGRGVPEERVTDILWPEAEGDSAHSAFTSTLSRLRKILGADHVLTFCEGKAMLDPRYCYVDVWEFERSLGAAFSRMEKASREQERTDAVELFQKALGIYTGPFLAGENEPFMVSIRERLSNKLLRAIAKCGLCLEQSGKPEQAIECYQKGLQVDELMEEFYRRMMKCYSRMGRRAEAFSVYQRCSRVLSSVLGINPSQETEALARELKK